MSLLGAIFGNAELENRLVKSREAAQAWKDEATRLKQDYENSINKHAAKVQSLEKEITTMHSHISSLETAAQEQKTQQKKQKAEIENLNNEISECDTIIKKLTESENWVCIGENDDEIGYGRTNKEGVRLDLVRVRKKHLKELPTKTENANDIFEDGSSYPCSLMDFIRGEKNKQVAPMKEEPNKNPSIKPSEVICQNKIDEEQNKNETKEGQEEEQEKDEVLLNVESQTDLSPNQGRVLNLIKSSPGLVHKDLAENLNMDKSNLSKVLASLMQKMLIRMEDQGRYFAVGN